MHVSGPTTPLSHLSSGGMTKPSISTKARFSLKLDVMTQNDIVLNAVYKHALNKNEEEYEEFTSTIKNQSSETEGREKFARHQKYLEGISIAKQEHNIYGEAAHEFAHSYSSYFFHTSIGKVILEEIAN